ncbi:MAG: hypothetical protein ACXVMS_05185 [Flavisolibacter sp.]
MSENLKDILSHLNPDIDQETLLLYLQGKLSAEQQHAVEQQMMDDDFELDAVEGLENFHDKKKLKEWVDQLNQGLRKKTARKKLNRQKLDLKIDTWVIITVITVLLLVIVSYFIIHHYLQP